MLPQYQKAPPPYGGDEWPFGALGTGFRTTCLKEALASQAEESLLIRRRQRLWLKALVGLVFGLGMFLGDSDSALAVSIAVSDYPSSISAEPFSLAVTISFSRPSPATNYLRVDLYKEGTTDYFGETFNGADWYGGSDKTKYWPVTIGEEKEVTTTMQGRVGSPKRGDYDGPGMYKLRVRRYTASSQLSDEQTPVEVQITLSTPLPSVMVSAMPTTVPTPTATVRPASLPTPGATPPLSRTPVLPLATSRSQPPALPTRLLITPFPSSVAKGGSFFSPLLAAASGGAKGWEVNLSRSTDTAEVFGSSANAQLKNSAGVLGVSVDKGVPLALSGAGLILVFLGLSSRWWRKPPPTVG